MKKIVLWFLVIVVSSGGIAAAAGGTVEEIQKRGALLAGVEKSSPPFSFTDPEKGEIVGVNIDLAREIAKKLNVELRLVTVTAGNRVPFLIDGKIDLIAGPMTKNTDRDRLVDFSQTYFVTTQRVVAKKGAVREVNDLLTRRIGVVRGTTSERNLRALVPGGDVRVFADLGAGVQALRTGEIDVFTGEGIRLYGVLAQLPEGAYEIPEGVRLAVDSFGMAVRKGDEGFLKIVNETLSDMDRSGKEKEICDRWLLCRPDTPQQAVAPASLPGANAVITRHAGTTGRFLALSVDGLFAEGANVSVFSQGGKLLGKGKIDRIYGDEIYLDVGAVSGAVGVGSIVSMNQTEGQVAEFIRTHNAVIANIKEEARQEESLTEKQIASESAKEKEKREQYQDEMTKLKTSLDYQYSDRYYYYRGWP
ncbi:MAG: transporter substrate-binding domain-containing protein [bacterium]|nr:transporter substrate-binding domain-containing protein [bacterium]